MQNLQDVFPSSLKNYSHLSMLQITRLSLNWDFPVTVNEIS